MKQTIFFSLLSLTSILFAQGQNVVSNSTLTSGGYLAGTGGTRNVFFGYQAGKFTTGNDNTFIGHQTGSDDDFGSFNTFVGSHAGSNNGGSNNTYLGAYSGHENFGNNNVFIGSNAGFDQEGSNNIFIGYNAGHAISTSAINNQLFIENSSSSTPLIWGDFTQDQLKFNAKVGIGHGFGNYPTTAGSVNVSTYNLFVKGGILTEEVRVSLAGTWADYVLHKDYNLKSLDQVEQFIIKNGHLPNVPSAQQVKENGIELGEMAKIQQEKIEELTLYIIEQHKEIEKLKTQIKEIETLKKIITELTHKE